jgi:hypothetical protein
MIVSGCARPAPPPPVKDPATMYQSDAAQGEVRQLFTDFQSAVKKRDGDKLWDLIAERSQQAADSKAGAIKEAFAGGDDKKKTEIEKEQDLSAAELKDLTGKRYLKSKEFAGKYQKVADGQLLQIVAKGEDAHVACKEADGAAMQFKLVQEKQRWKLVVDMP